MHELSDNDRRTDSQHQARDCDRCGRDRPANPKRFTVTASDFTESTAAYEKVFLCADCWRGVRDGLRECFA